MLEKTNPDIAIIAVPTALHKKFALASVVRGIHTFVEKPIATTLCDLNELINLSKEHKCRITAGHVERYNPVTIKIKSLIGNSHPPATKYEFVRTQAHNSRIEDDIVIDKVIHDLDLAICLFGEIKEVYVDSVRNRNGIIHEAGINLVHKIGTCGSIFVSWLKDESEKTRQVTIHQGGHVWRGDFASKKLWVDGHEMVCRVDGMVNESNNQIKDELTDFIASCYGQEYCPKIMPLLRMDEIVQATRWLEYINVKCGEMNNERKDSISSLCAS